MPATKNEVLKPSLQFKASEDTKKTSLKEDDPSKTTNIGVGLSHAWECALVEFLKANSDIFAWQPSDMTGVPRELSEHSLNVYPDAKPVKQSLRRFGDEKRKAIAKELARLELAGFITEVIHTIWVENPVLVPKKDTIDLRMCVDYTALNKACPKDQFP